MFVGGQLIHGSGPNLSQTVSRRPFIGLDVDDATASLSKCCHPVPNAAGEVVSTIAVNKDGGPCGDGIGGGVD